MTIHVYIHCRIDQRLIQLGTKGELDQIYNIITVSDAILAYSVEKFIMKMTFHLCQMQYGVIDDSESCITATKLFLCNSCPNMGNVNDFATY